MIEDFENVCGEAPKDTENLNFQVSDPNFVFENDPSYQTIVLYDRDGNVVNVNSWIECAHYVNGGWNNVNYTNFGGDQTIFIGLLFVFSFYILIKRFIVSDD
tara:strand:+ start:802 stop:1107 length:306 start_codon:yes stop_codon:yes gene_type:complete